MRFRCIAEMTRPAFTGAPSDSTGGAVGTAPTGRRAAESPPPAAVNNAGMRHWRSVAALLDVTVAHSSKRSMNAAGSSANPVDPRRDVAPRRGWVSEADEAAALPVLAAASLAPSSSLSLSVPALRTGAELLDPTPVLARPRHRRTSVPGGPPTMRKTLDA